MDPLQSAEIVDSEENSQTAASLVNSAVEVFIQLQGSHVTSTETDATFGEYKKIVKFQDYNETEKLNLKEEENRMLKDKVKEGKENNESGDQEKFQDDREEILTDMPTKDNYLEQKELQQKVILQPARELTNSQPQHKYFANDDIFKNNAENKTTEKDQLKMQNISSERKEISQRLEHIIDMFDSFSRNLESLDLKTKPKTVKSAAKGCSTTKRPLTDGTKEQQPEVEEPVRQRSRFEEQPKIYLIQEDLPNNQDAVQLPQSNIILDSSSAIAAAEIEHVQDYLKHQQMALDELENEAKTMKAIQGRSVSTATSSSWESKSFGCQTQFADRISLSTLDLVEVSSLASRSQQPNSLNNFATADNACVTYYGSQQDITKQPLIEQPITTPAVIVHEPPHFSVITIEANARPSSIDLRRTPFWQRLWEVIGDFCAATFLCLQVNRDCIFCLGFVVAFVASVSFLTAFFYHTIIISPTLWQS